MRDKSTIWPIELDMVRARPEGKKGIYVAHYHRDGDHCRKTLGTARREVALREAMTLEMKLQQGAAPPISQDKEIESAISEFLAAKTIDGLAAKSMRKYETELRHLQEIANQERVRFVRRLDESFLSHYRRHRANQNLLKENVGIHEKLPIRQP